MLRNCLWVLLVVILSGCGQEPQEWNPVFEATNFDAIKTEVDRSLALMDAAYGEATQTDAIDMLEKIDQARQRLLALKDYYLPLTTVRQTIYDAERYLKLDRRDKARQLIEKAQGIVASLGMVTQNAVFDKIVIELKTMLDEVVAAMNRTSTSDSYQKIKLLGEHVNLMLVKGDLVLSG
uniref:hypothetical protein n=1 Tax=Desulfosarcina cetonica TaxID=90730 RepID=UPI0006CFEEBB